MKEINSPNDTQLKLEAGAGQGYNGKDTKAYEAYLSILDDVDLAKISGMSARDYAISKGVPSSLTDEVADLLDKYNFRMDADPDNRTMSPDERAEAVDDWNGDGGTEGAGETFVDNPFDGAGNLKANVEYQSGEFDYNYGTDSLGRLEAFQTDNLRLTERTARLSHNPNTPGKLPGDHAGHIAGDRFGGSGDLDNLVPNLHRQILGHIKKLKTSGLKQLKKEK